MGENIQSFRKSIHGQSSKLSVNGFTLILSTKFDRGYGAAPSDEETNMTNKAGRSVYQRPNNDWVNKRNDAGRAGSIRHTQKEKI